MVLMRSKMLSTNLLYFATNMSGIVADPSSSAPVEETSKTQLTSIECANGCVNSKQTQADEK